MAELIGTEEDLAAFNRLPESERKINDKIRGVLAETAASGIVRYDWPLIMPAVEQAIRDALKQFYDVEHGGDTVEVGPPRPLASGESFEELLIRFHEALLCFPTDAPFTIQRLCEIVLQPSNLYSKLDKLTLACEKLVTVTSTIAKCTSLPPLPELEPLMKMFPPTGPPVVKKNPGPQTTTVTHTLAKQGSGLLAAQLQGAAGAGREPGPPPAPEAGAAGQGGEADAGGAEVIGVMRQQVNIAP